MTTPRRLVRISEVQRPHPSCLAALRKLHPRLELVCLTPGVWWIGEVNRTSAAVLAGQQRRRTLMDRLRAGLAVRSISFWKAELQAQGFRMLALVSAPQPTPSMCVHAVAPALKATPRSLDATWAAGMREATGEAKREANTKWLREEYAVHAGRDSYRHAYHKPIHSLPGVRS